MTDRAPSVEQKSPSGRRSGEREVCLQLDCPMKEQLKQEQLRCSKLVAANQILRETQQYLMDKCTAVTEEANRLALEVEATQEAARARELAVAAEQDHLRGRLEDARRWQARVSELEESNRELHSSLIAANQDKSVLVAQVTMLQQMLERLTNAHEQLVSMHHSRTPQEREPSFHSPPLRDDLSSPPPPPPPALDDDTPRDSEHGAGTSEPAAILPMKQALEELHHAETTVPQASGLSLLKSVIAEKKAEDSYYDTFEAVERLQDAQQNPAASSSATSDAGSVPHDLVATSSVKDLIKAFEPQADGHRSPSAASLERLLKKDKNRRDHNVPELLPQRHQPHMAGLQMGSVPPPPPNPQESLQRSAHKTLPDGPAIGKGSPNRVGSADDE